MGSRRLAAACCAVLVAVGLAAIPVRQAGPPGLVRAALVPNDTFFGAFAWPAKSANLPRAWDVTTGNASITIAVLDTGVSPVADLAGALVPGHDFVGGGNDTSDPNGHGTEVATVAAARIGNGLGVAGACGRCSIMPVRVLDQNGVGDPSRVAEGIAWAVAHGADVINLSFASTSDDSVLDAAIDDAIAHGVTVVIAAGNAGSADPAGGGYPAAGSPGAIRVGAIDPANALYGWSNRGSWVDVAAPGAAAAGTVQGSFYLGAQGTSVAASLVSGVVGLLLSRHPALTPAAIKSLIDTTGTPVSGLDVASGKRINAYAALTAAG